MTTRITICNGFFSLLILFLFSACQQNEKIFEGDPEFVVGNLAFPEGPVFMGNDLYFSNSYGGWIGRFTEKGTLDTFVDLSPYNFKPNGLYASKNQELWVCEYQQGLILTVNNQGEVTAILDYQGTQFSRPNDITYHKGLIYFTDPKTYATNVRDGCIYILDPETKKIRLFATDLAFPNGIAGDPKGEKIYVCESALNRISTLSIKNPEERSVFINLPGGDPDGIEFLDDQTLFVAHFGGGKIYAINVSQKTLIDSVEFPGKRVSNCAVSPDKKYLYVTETETHAIYRVPLHH
ncbi:MAG: SMP-30/gluconolactonase/LRE family protein [Candidatus Marinimicrobia bacterium]|nr:SMP-30/gluconolactonase/LRE family protein [Candidatus Neomarinimicrobiota bacterium]